MMSRASFVRAFSRLSASLGDAPVRDRPGAPSRRRRSAIPLVGGGALLLATSALAQPADSSFTVDLRPIATGLVAPAMLTHAGDGSGRIFVAEQTGAVRIIQNGSLLPTPFLNIASLLVPLNPGYDERGLLGIAFHPQYEQNGRFFLRYSRARVGMAGEPCFGSARGCHEEVLAEFHVSASDPNVADPTPTLLLRVDKPQFNHNGGGIAFGPDGFLYFTLGDGGGANDGLADNPPSHGPIGNGQNLDSILGKLLRIDIDGAPPYAIPPSNPFVGTGHREEIYAYGFRNPYQFSFDAGGSNQLILADVGQDLFEEVNIVTAGGNYGWVIREARHCFDPFNPLNPPATCDTTGLIDPIAEYRHSDASGPIGLSIIGGYVYRGTQFPGLFGKYFFGDFSTSFAAPNGHLFFIDTVGDLNQIFRPRLGAANAPFGLYVKGFGEDESGEIYVLATTNLGPAGTSGRVLRVAACRADFNASGAVNSQDFFDFLTPFFEANADFNGDGSTNSQDFFDFLTAFFNGC